MSLNIVTKIDKLVPLRHVLVSVSNKTGLDRFIAGLAEACPTCRFYSTGGTFKALQDILPEGGGKRLVQVSAYTGQPEMQGGLVKTLDFKIYLGLLSETYNPAHADDLKRTDAVTFDMVVANLYPFKETITRLDTTVEKARSHIDIGGPCMVRAAAKNFIRVASVTDPEDYPAVLKEIIKENGRITLKTRYALARKAFAHTADYDASISGYLARLRYEDMLACYNFP